MNPSWHIVLCNVGGANAAKDATRTNIEAACAFKPTAAGAEENYIGTVHHSGAGKESSRPRWCPCEYQTISRVVRAKLSPIPFPQIRQCICLLARPIIPSCCNWSGP